MKSYTFDYNRLIIKKNEFLNMLKKCDEIDAKVYLRDFVLIYIIDYNNYDLPILKDNEFLINMLQKLDKDTNCLIDIDNDLIDKVLNITTHYRINNILNKKIVLLIADYLNKKEDNMITEIDLKELALYCDSFDTK